MRVDLLDKEFQRMSCANSDLMASISEANTENFDYENLGEAKCKEIVSRGQGSHLSEVTDRFNKGGIADKRRVLSALGSNPSSTDKICLK